MIKGLIKKIDENRDFFTTKKFFIICSIILCCSLGFAGGLYVFNAGNIQGNVTIQDTPPVLYDVLIDGSNCPTTITDSVTMTADSTQEIQHNLKNNENFNVDFEITPQNIDAGLTLNIYDGTMTPSNLITVPANSNKWLILHYVTDNTVTNGDILTSDILIEVTQS